MRSARARCAPRIAVLDTETTPFDANSDVEILPFCAEIWDGARAVVIWENDYEIFVEKLYEALINLDAGKKWIVYAHNGGKFDFMFLVQKLRGTVAFKGSAIMRARIAPHVELRDSMHIIPDALKSYKKDEFDYDKMRPKTRDKHRAEILEYLHSDCVYLYDLVTHFQDKHGPKISIGQAAWHCLKQDHDIENLGEAADEYLRQWYFGGRVECMQGSGHFSGDYQLIDVNSMFPDRMAALEHPIGCEFSIRSQGRPKITHRTVFLEVECENFGAFAAREEHGALSFNLPRGKFKTTIWEFEAAESLGLIRNARVLTCIDFYKRSNFEKFVVPRYRERQSIKDQIDAIENSNILDELQRESLIIKLEMNNAYGKGAQNPRKFKEYLYTDCKERPPGEHVGINQYMDKDEKIWTLHLESEGEFLVWEKPISQLRFNNVAMSASITGAARAKLLHKIAGASDPIYCDTDSVICRHSGDDVSSNVLGDWKIEKRISEALIAGKKLYGYRHASGDVIRSKGGRGLHWSDLAAIVRGNEISKRALAPKFDKSGFQDYSSRTFKLTCPRGYQSRIFSAC